MFVNVICANKNNGDKFYRRKSMWGVDKKLIINKLGPNYKIQGRMKYILAIKLQLTV